MSNNKQINNLSGCSGVLFLMAGLFLLVIKLVTSATFSWFWVFGVMFFPMWFVLSIVALFISVVVGIICILLVACLIAFIPWLIWVLFRKITKTRNKVQHRR